MVFLRKLLLLVFAVCLITVPVIAQQKVKIEGVWRMVSGKQDGKETLAPGTDLRYFVTAKHLIWIWQNKAKTISALAKKQQGDPLKAYMEAFGAGAGTYKSAGNTCTVTIEQWQDPDYIGLSIDFAIRIEGNRLYQSFNYPIFEKGKKARIVFIEEVYERLEGSD